MTKRREPATPKNLSDLRSMIAARSVIFPDLVESVVRKALAEPELIAFGSTYSVAAACSVSQTTVVRVSGLLGFASFGELRTLFREHLCDRIGRMPHFGDSSS
ncbi:transcriptional regulator [Sinorhizobium meliloti]|jgi:DNA-binding MurR/RpiR family transcriptional regulator|uniref:transcriptional regulator n=1 Tax=Rhizobium meliloti TaxID=382 RepID=UPI0020BE55F4|nr:transcriptional regulator [Sinorhizobium meliloti]